MFERHHFIQRFICFCNRIFSIIFIFSYGIYQCQASPLREPCLKWDAETVVVNNKNFGVDGGIDIEFHYTNITEDPVLISNIKGDCTCVDIKWKKDSIAAGETGKVSVHLKASNPSIRRESNLIVETASGQTHRLSVIIPKEEDKNIQYDPTILRFNSLNEGHAAVVKITGEKIRQHSVGTISLSCDAVFIDSVIRNDNGEILITLKVGKIKSSLKCFLIVCLYPQDLLMSELHIPIELGLDLDPAVP